MNLSKRQIHILNSLYPDKRITAESFAEQFGVAFDSPESRALQTEKLLTSDTSMLYGPHYTLLTEQGRAYVEGVKAVAAEKKAYRIHEWINTAIAFIALIIAIASLIVSL